MDVAVVRRRLPALFEYDDALEFFGDLGYSYADDAPLYRGDWPASTQDLPIARLEYLAQHQDSFHIIYCELNDKRLLRQHQRPILDQIAHRHPFFMVVFRNQAERIEDVLWEFVNVRLVESTNRRAIRRISIGPAERLHDRLHTAADRLARIDISQQPTITALELQTLHDQAFDVEAVTKSFFTTYRSVFEEVEASITGIDGDARRLFTQRLFNRLMFIVFLEHKGWLRFRDRADYLYALWEDYQRDEGARGGTSFYEARLIPLFFAGLNSPNEVNIMVAGGHDQGMIQQLIGNVPYLNGGLFERAEDERNGTITIPDEGIERILDELFYHFNFTVNESTPQEIEVAVDPEMLGRIFEELVTGRHESGSYYTPKSVVSFMGREALKGYLETACPTEEPDPLAAFVDEHDPTGLADPETVLDVLRTVRICDPACGSGAYLLGMLHELIDLRTGLFRVHQLDSIRVYDRKLDIIQHNLYGVDIDPFAVNIARLRLWLSLIVDFEGNDPPPLPNLDFKIEVGDSLIAPDPSGGLQPDLIRYTQIQDFLELKNDYLSAHHENKLTLRKQIVEKRSEIAEWARADAVEGFDWAVDFAEVFHTESGISGFDIVLANPPYVRQELIKEQKPTLKRVYGNLYNGRADLYVYFYFRALQLLKPGGMFAFISSNKWLRAGYGEKLRSRLSTNTTLHSVIDFGDLSLFGAIAYPMIVIARRQEVEEFHPGPHALTANSLEILSNLTTVAQAAPFIPQRLLRSDGWQLAAPQVMDLMQKLRASGISLGKYVDGKFYMGIKTGRNKAFEINQTVRDRLIAEDPRSAEIIKQWLRGRDVKRWGTEWANLYIIFTYHGVDIARYSAIETYLQQFKPSLLKRATSANHEWYELQQPQMGIFTEFEKPKIVYPEFGILPQFSFDSSATFIANKLFCIPDASLYLLGILNSSVSHYFLMNITSHIQSDYIEFRQIHVSRMPIPNANQALYADIESVVGELLALRGRGPRVTNLEAELNRLVYQAYDLTPAEIALIEESVNAKGRK